MSDQRNPSNAPAKGAGPETPAGPRLRNDDKVAIVIIVLSALVYWVSTTFDDVPKALAQGMQPAAYPQLLVGALIVLSIILVFENRARQEKSRKPVKPMVYYTGAVLAVSVLLITWLGIFGAMVIPCAVIPFLWGDRRTKAVIAFVVTLPIVVYLLFHGILEVQFPLGIFENLF